MRLPYLLNHLGLDPNNTLKRLGDGFYEQQLIREQIVQLTGYRYLDGYSSDDAQYTALMNAGVTFAQQYGLRPGVALTAAQMAQLTSDIVWLVEQTVTLPDGSTQRVLVPQVYVRVQPGDIDGSGALLSGNEVKVDGKNSNFTNSGTVAGRQVVSINANTIDNLGGRIAGASVGLKAQLDINNIGGTIAARDKLTLDAGRDINVRTTTQTNMGVASGTNIDRVAGLYVTNPGGTLVASAGHDVNLIGAVIANAGTGKTSITAKNDINLGTVTEAGSSTSQGVNANFQGGYPWSKEIGTQISGGGNVALDAGNDVAARAATVSAGGDLSVHAGNDITIESGRETSDFGFTATRGTKGIVTRTTNTVAGEAHTNTAIGSTFSGNNVAMDAGRDINIVGSDVNARGNATLNAVRNVNVVSALEEASTNVESSRTTNGLITSGPLDHNRDLQRSHSDSIQQTVQNERAATITAGGNLSVTAGKQVNIYASNLSAGQDLNVTGQEVTVLSGTNYSSTTVASGNDRQTAVVTGVPVRMGQGFNADNSVSNTSTSTTLAAATLSGRNVNITATDGDITLGAAHINATDVATLNAPQGDINFNIVRTGTELTQTRGEGDLVYARNRDNGLQTQAANYTQVNAGQLTLNAQGINVEVGRSASGSGANGQLGYVQSVQDALAQQIGQPGMNWLTQIQNDPALANVPINWSSVPLETRHWAEGQGGLTQAGGAIVTIVASVLSWGTASAWGASAAQGVGFTSTAAGTAGGVFAGAVAAGITSIASQAAVSLINNNGNIGAVIEELTSSQGIRRIVTAMATAGAVQGLDAGLGIGGWTANGAAAGTASWPQVLGRNLLDGVAGSLVYAAVNGTSAEDAIRNGLLNGLLNTAAAGSAQWIGGNAQGFANAVAHAIAGCVVGAGRANLGGGISGGDGCSAGAIGAVAGHLAAEFLIASGPRATAEVVEFSQLIGGVAGALVGGNQESADIAAAAAGNSAEHNECGSTQMCSSRNNSFAASHPLLDSNGRAVYGGDGKPIYVPDGVDMADFARMGRDAGSIAAWTNLQNFAQGASWDLQRLGPYFDSLSVDAATVAIGVYAASAGIPFGALMNIQNIYANLNSRYPASIQMIRVMGRCQRGMSAIHASAIAWLLRARINKMSKNLKLMLIGGLVSFSILCAFLFYDPLRLRTSSSIQTELIEEKNSPSGRWLAVKVFRVYGDGKLVSVPVYEIIVKAINESDVVVYSTVDGGIDNLFFSWTAGDVLVIKDARKALDQATINPSKVKVLFECVGVNC